MLVGDAYDNHVAARLLDFFGTGTPWQRRLWVIGLVLGIRELLEAADAAADRVLSWGSVVSLASELARLAGRDAVIASSPLEAPLNAVLVKIQQEKELDPRGHEAEVLRGLLAKIDPDYLTRLALVIQDPRKRPKPERAARSIASHLLDSGYSATFLNQWWTYRVKSGQVSRSLADLVGEADGLLRGAANTFDALVAFESISSSPSHPVTAANWRSSGDVRTWLARNGFPRSNIRQQGGLLLTITARDGWAAAELASELVEQTVARFALGSRGRVRAFPHVWIRGQKHPFPVGRPKRGVEVHALQREDRLFATSASDKMDAAIELLGPLENGPPAPAVSGGWSALETLLTGAGDSEKGVAAERLATIIACSFSRAELTTLSYSHKAAAQDAVMTALNAATTQLQRASIVLAELRAGRALQLADASDLAAQVRIRDVLANPRERLQDIRLHAAASLRRLYRQRNLVVHGGRLTSVALRAALRATAPLVGAGVDRLAHAWFTHETQPIVLAARSKVSLDTVGSTHGTDLAQLLE